MMGIRKTVEDTLVIAGPRNEWLPRCRDALEAQGFKKVNVSETLFQISASYKQIAGTVWGTIELTLLPEIADSTRITVKATANVDNIYALFASPGQKMIDRFKQGLAPSTPG